ncbi:MAG: type II toxin-antitoxin system PemK/MazF family toxin [Pyrinomonadaceae bacterium]|nr:type II toxin-antitoxin system PemK/MazF family toxin [Pyrinomonadaceae bacterium]
MVVERGEIWWANLLEPVGSSPGFPRPVLIIQSDKFNRSRINTVVIAIISTNLKLADSEGNVLLTARQTNLPKNSVVSISQLFTIDESVLRDFVGVLSANKMERVDKGLRLILSLPKI